MKIVVCGDSWCSADRNGPGAHFSELLAQDGHDVTNIARGGATNALICFQLQTAISLQPDLVIMNQTDAHRINVFMNQHCFDPKAGLKNFAYPYHADSSFQSPLVGDIEAAIWSDVPETMIQGRADLPLCLTSQQILAVKYYVAHMLCHPFQQLCDSWMIGYWKCQMQGHDIAVLDISEHAVGKILLNYAGDRTKTNYHTDQPTQQQFAAAVRNLILQGALK